MLRSDLIFMTKQGLQQLEEVIDSLRKAMNQQKARHEHALAEMAKQEAEEFATLEQRVKATVAKKDTRIAELQQQLSTAQLKAKTLEDLLENQRRELMKI